MRAMHLLGAWGLRSAPVRFSRPGSKERPVSGHCNTPATRVA
jgi:hypothetical protein